MSNTIQIKSGPGKPSDGVLQKGELGYDITNGFLYIGNASNKTVELKVAYATSAGTAENATNLSGTLGIDKGGTNATTATVALANLGGVPTSRTINGKPLSSNISLSASDVGARDSTWMPTAANVGAVPTTRTVNGKALSTNITLSASDVGARASTWMPTAADVGARPSTWTPTASDVGAVPTSRTINGKALSSNITLTASDIGVTSGGCETATHSSISGNSSKTFTFTKNVKAVFVTAYSSSSGKCVAGFWDTNTSGKQQALYGWATTTLDTWPTTVTISGKEVTVSRNSTTALYYSVTAFF